VTGIIQELVFPMNHYWKTVVWVANLEMILVVSPKLILNYCSIRVELVDLIVISPVLFILLLNSENILILKFVGIF